MSDNEFSVDLGEKYIRIADVAKGGTEVMVKALAYDEANVNIFVTEG